MSYLRFLVQKNTMCIFLGNLKIFIFSLFVFYIVDNDNQQYNKDEFENKDIYLNILHNRMNKHFFRMLETRQFIA